MKRLSLALVALLLIGVFLTACAAPALPTEKSGARSNAGFQSQKIRVGVDARLRSFEMLDPNENDFAGFDIELMQAIASKAGLDVEFVNVGFDQLITFIGRCQLDIGISAIAITDELKQQVNFSSPYLTTGHVVVVKKGNLTITGRDKLSDMTVGTQAGTLSEIETRKIVAAQVKAYPNFQLAFRVLTAGYIDAVIADKPHALSYVNIKPNNLKIVGDEFGSVNYGIALCKTRVDLTETINTALVAVKADGTLNSLKQKWINK